ncbi:MAG TPA: galactose oxidase early set domain-containing protein, partial [Thermoanaerobaculia bacterium]
LDVLGALEDPNRETPAENHYTLLAEALRDRHYCCPTASLLEIDKQGRTTSHKWLMFSGRERGTGALTATIEEIELTDPNPQWRTVGALVHPSTTSKAVLLPDGTILIGNGLFPQGSTFEQRAGLRYQLFDPATGTTRALVKTTVPRGLHGTATLLPDATVLFAGENREALVRPDDPSFPMAGFPVGDPDLGVPNGQIVRPPYLFDEDGDPASRPVILSAPGAIEYKDHFDIKVAGRSDAIRSVAILRSDHNTHSLTTGDRYVRLAFEPKGDPRKGELRIVTPRLPAQAVPGIYMLFVVNADGVPSTAKRVDLTQE